MRKHVLIGIGAALVLLMAYLGIITLAESLKHALDQTADLWYWIAALVAGFGVQAGLFSFIRDGLRRRGAATASVAATGGVSTGSMAACCAHHLTDVLPLFGLSGLTTFLTQYQTLFIVIGVVSNLVGITIMLETIQRQRLSPKLANWQWNMGRVRKGATLVAVLVIAIVAVRTVLIA
ncbi:MAG: hypothetical protein HYX91_01765 [Chloroflexi bacterium]|nr:hypothetical protein [Chloroflexota bacterium]